MSAFRFGALALGVMVAGCTAQMSTDVTRFNQLSVPSSGETVAVVAADPSLNGSMEFASVAGIVQQKLGAYGYEVPLAGRSPDIIAEISYHVTHGPEGLRDNKRSPVSVGLGVGGGSGGYHGGGVGVGLSTGFNLGGGNDDAGTYRRLLTVVMTRTSDQTRLFEGRAQSVGGATSLGVVGPYLVDAVFTDFPGKNGETRTIKKPIKK